MFDNLFKEEKKEKTFNVEDRVMKYQEMFIGTLSEDTHTPFTFQIEDKTRERLESLHNKLNIENGVSSVRSSTFKTRRKLLRGYKYKFMNTAINYFLDMYEQEEGKIGHIESISFKVGETINHRLYIEDLGKGKYTLIEHNHKAKEIKREEGVSESYLNQKLSAIKGDMVRVGRAKKEKKTH